MAIWNFHPKPQHQSQQRLVNINNHWRSFWADGRWNGYGLFEKYFG